ncbi:MAG: nucleotidyltransferase domain-containing protein [Ilumatobacteraceae bacterium]
MADTIEIFRGATFRWWISGGLALELHLGRSWRDHDDTDVSLVRGDVPELRSVLDGWDIHVAAAGQLESWTGHELLSERHQNNLRCRRDANGPWCLDVTISEGDSDCWVYRRDPRIRIPWADAVLQTANSVPYLAPELQLLFKSKDHREKDDVDARQVIPELSTARRDRLARLLPTTHPWHDLLSSLE